MKYPQYLSKEIKDLLVLVSQVELINNVNKFFTWMLLVFLIKLLNKTPEVRLGMSGCPAGDIFIQPFFSKVEWEKVEKCQVKPPFVPKLVSKKIDHLFDTLI